MSAGLVNAAAADTLELTETNVESVLDEIRPYLMADGESHFQPVAIQHVLSQYLLGLHVGHQDASRSITLDVARSAACPFLHWPQAVLLAMPS